MNAIHRHLGVGAVLLAVAWSTGCTEELTVPNFNNPAREDLTGTPTRGTANARNAAAVQRPPQAGQWPQEDRVRGEASA